MDRKYFHELARILAKQGIKSIIQREDNLTILLDGQPACHVGATSQMFIAPGDMRTPEADDLYHRTAPIAETVREYMTAIEKAPLLKARDLDENFRLLTEFNGTVLAGRETEKGYGYKLVTRQRDYDGTGVYATLNLIFGYAELQEMIVKNPMERVEAPEKTKMPVDAMNEEQAKQFFSLLPALPLDFYCMLLLFATTGIRRCECVGLKWRDLDEVACAIHIERGGAYTARNGVSINTPKTANSVRTIPLMPRTMQLLQQYALTLP